MNETNKSTMMEHINLIDGMNLNPLTLEAGNEMTTAGWLLAIQNKINEIANELGVNFGRKATAEENGAVGGEITRRLIAQAKQSLIK